MESWNYSWVCIAIKKITWKKKNCLRRRWIPSDPALVSGFGDYHFSIGRKSVVIQAGFGSFSHFKVLAFRYCDWSEFKTRYLEITLLDNICGFTGNLNNCEKSEAYKMWLQCSKLSVILSCLCYRKNKLIWSSLSLSRWLRHCFVICNYSK